MRALENEAFSIPSAAGRRGSALFVHGLGGGPYEIRWLAEALHARTGLGVRGFHLPGHEAPRTFMPASRHEDWTAAVAREMRDLAANGPVHLVGFSNGGTVCLRVAETEPMSGKLVLLAPFVDVFRPAWLPVRPEVLLDAFAGLGGVPRRGARLGDPEVLRAVRRCLPFRTMSLDAARSGKALGEAALRDLAKVKVPVLILQGARDGVVDPAGARKIEAGLTGEKRLVVLPRSDHLIALDVERERVFDEVTAFLAHSL